VPSVAGLHVCARATVDGGPIVAQARQNGVGVQALTDFCAGGPQQGLVIGYGGIRLEQIAEGPTRLELAGRQKRRRLAQAISQG
jgi:GntR family transcriptional regulator/MocR family aminotransferase